MVMNLVGSSAAQQHFDRFFHSAPPEVDREAIRQEWLALKPPYQLDRRSLPLPVWARRSFTETGEAAWAELCRDASRMDSARAFCIYLHLPFCARRCSFCDCYSFPLKQHRARHIETYLALLTQEMGLWSQLGPLAQRPVSTIHLGGGTPTFLGTAAFNSLVQACHKYFSPGPGTEWALESTTSELTADMYSLLDSLGFTRLHLGVQSLEDTVRRNINRQEPGAVVLEKIARATERGWVVSVDLILGLPGQSLTSVMNDIKTLALAGVDGFSLYELQLSSRNRKFAEQYGLLYQTGWATYFLFQAASRLLASLGYRKTLFNHFARQRDTNLYFTFPERGEDCLALGTIADGILGDYHYRHPEYAAYCRGVSPSFPGLQGGLRRNELENRLHPLETAMMSGSLPLNLFLDTLDEASARSLLSYWGESRLVEDDTRPGYLRLTANGSWFTGTMMAQLAAAL